MKGETTDPIFGRGKYTYKVNEDWAKPPANVEIRAQFVGSQDRVYCFNRNAEHPIVIFDRERNFLSSWGAGLFKFPHAIASTKTTSCGSATNITGNSISSRPLAGERRHLAKRQASQNLAHRRNRHAELPGDARAAQTLPPQTLDLGNNPLGRGAVAAALWRRAAISQCRRTATAVAGPASGRRG